MTDIMVVDYGMGNLKSVQRGLEQVGATVMVSSDPEELLNANKLVLPGVGAFEDGIAGLKNKGLIDMLKAYVNSGKPLIGICLGMQMLLDRSEEHGDHQGLGMIPGKVVGIPRDQKQGKIRKIPHIGWSALRYPAKKNNWEQSWLRTTEENEYFYFVHSFMAVPTDSAHVLAECEYEGMRITAAIQCKNVTGFQFHPEKSGELGLKILREFVDD